MKAFDLLPFVAPVVEKPVCRSCKTFAPDAQVPVGDGAVGMCWGCAHHVIDHEATVEAAFLGRCKCHRDQIYPYAAAQASNLKAGDAAVSGSATKRASRRAS